MVPVCGVVVACTVSIDLLFSCGSGDSVLSPRRASVKSTVYLFSVGDVHLEGSRPEWCISSMIYSKDIPFWSETLNLLEKGFSLKLGTVL